MSLTDLRPVRDNNYLKFIRPGPKHTQQEKEETRTKKPTETTAKTQEQHQKTQKRNKHTEAETESDREIVLI